MLRYHLDNIRRISPDVLGISPYLESSPCDTQATIQGLTNVLDFPSPAVYDLIPYIPRRDWYYSPMLGGEEWEDRKSKCWDTDLLTWKDVRKPQNLFIKGLGVFDIKKAYEKCSSRRRKEFAWEILHLFKDSALRNAFKSELNAGRIRISDAEETPVQSTNGVKTLNIKEIKNHLANSVEVDLLGFFITATPSDFKEGNFCSHLPPFPLFVTWEGQDGPFHNLEWNEFSPVQPSLVLRWVDEDCLKRCLYTGAYFNGLFWLPSVSELQAFGYFARVDEDAHLRTLSNILSKDESCPQRQHLIRYYHFWNHPDNIGSIDEMEMAVGTSPYREFWPENGATMQPLQLLNLLRGAQRKGPLGREERFVYLDELPDHGQCRVLRSNYEIADVADELKNCARSYISEVKAKKVVLVVLEDKNGTAVALGMHPLRGNLTRSGWTEIREKCNRHPSKETIEKFDSYSRILHRWHDDVFHPEDTPLLKNRK